MPLEFVLLALPAGAEANFDPPARHHVQRGKLFGQQNGGAQRRDHHSSGQADMLGRAGHRRQHRNRLIPGKGKRGGEFAVWIFVSVFAHDHMVDDIDLVDTFAIGDTRDLQRPAEVAIKPVLQAKQADSYSDHELLVPLRRSA